jgi:TetR/AcrR family transcriptional repressor of nem operon
MATVKKGTKEKIVSYATELVETKGYHSFTFQEIAKKLGIKKASIHYHFASKEDLGIAVFEAFEKGVENYMAEANFANLAPTEKMAGYFVYHSTCTLDSNQEVSCIGALTSEWNVLPKKLRDKVDKFHVWHVGILSAILKEGMETGDFQFMGTPEEQALVVIATTKGALLLARENRSIEIYNGITIRFLEGIKSRRAKAGKS